MVPDNSQGGLPWMSIISLASKDFGPSMGWPHSNTLTPTLCLVLGRESKMNGEIEKEGNVKREIGE